MRNEVIEMLKAEADEKRRQDIIMEEIHALSMVSGIAWNNRIPLLVGQITDEGSIKDIHLLGIMNRNPLDIELTLGKPVKKKLKESINAQIIFEVHAHPITDAMLAAKLQEKKRPTFFGIMQGYLILEKPLDQIQLIKYASEHRPFEKYRDELQHRYFSIMLANSLMNRFYYKYPQSIIQRFLLALNTTQIITIHGAPGTGKTTFVTQMAEALGAKCEMVIVQNNWTDSSDLLGFYNPISKVYQSTTFLDMLIAAKNDYEKNHNNARLYIICLDEMNLSRIEYYFATFLSILQLAETERWIRLLPYDVEEKARKATKENEYKEYLELKRYCSFLLPPNVRFVGTLNFDETATIPSPKVVDRSFYIEFKKDKVKWEEPTSKSDSANDCYIPISFFNTGVFTGNELPEGCSDGSMRHQTYVRQMYEMWNTYQFGDANAFTTCIKDGRKPYAERKNDWEKQMNEV